MMERMKLSSLTHKATALWHRALRMNKKQKITAGIGLAVVIVAIMFLHGGSDPIAESAKASRAVEVRSVAELASQSAPLTVVGSVSSVSEASVRAETSGQVTRVNRALGDSVSAGTIIVEIEASSQRAALLQAQGAVDAAKASLAKVQSGTRPEQLGILQSSLEGAKSGAVNTLLAAYSAVDNAISGGVDAMFDNARGSRPNFVVTVPDSQLIVSIEDGRIAMNTLLQRQEAAASTVSAGADLLGELTRTEAELRSVRGFLDSIITGLNKAIATISVPTATISGYQATAVAARGSVNASLASISAARQALQTAQKNMEQGVSGPVDEDVAASNAALKQAEGTYAAALANLEKALVRAPISGTINSLSIKRGDYLSQSTPVVTIANNGALEVVAYVTEQDMRHIKAGDKVSLEEGAEGVVTRIAPALDPVTKKIEVRIGVTGSGKNLVNGQSISVTFQRRGVAVGAVDTSRLSIPISAIKVGSDESNVFTVSAEGTLEAHPVVLGELLGERVIVSTGLTPEMMIVTDARGLRAGQQVSTK